MRLAGYGLEDAYAEQPDMGVIRRHGIVFQISTEGIRPTGPPRPMPAMSPSTDLTAPKFDFRSSPDSGFKSDIGPRPFRANFGIGSVVTARKEVERGQPRPDQRPVERTAQRAVLTKPLTQDLNQTLICAVPQ